MATSVKNGRTFRTETEMIDATMMSRPDTSWSQIDGHGHEHCWYTQTGAIAQAYTPVETYTLPTLLWVVDGVLQYEDGSDYEYGHHECKKCGDTIVPGHCSDTHRQMMPGLTSFYIDDRLVSTDEFLTEFRKEHP